MFEPKPYVSFSIGDPVLFVWQKLDLTAEQYYSIRVTRKGKPEEDSCIRKQTQESETALKLDCEKGIYEWAVTILTKLPPDGEGEWRIDSGPGWVFEFGLGEPHPDFSPGGSNDGSENGGGNVGID